MCLVARVAEIQLRLLIVRQYVYSVHWLNQCIRVVFVKYLPLKDLLLI